MVDVEYIMPPEVLQQLTDRAFVFRRHQEMDVVGHEHIGVDGAAIAAMGAVARCGKGATRQA